MFTFRFGQTPITLLVFDSFNTLITLIVGIFLYIFKIPHLYIEINLFGRAKGPNRSLIFLHDEWFW